MAGGSASALSLSRPSQALLTLRPAGSLSHPKVTFVTRLQPVRLPAQAARQLPDQSTTLRVDSSSTDDSRLRGALPTPDSCTAAKTAVARIASSARASSVFCTVRPSALADLRLITSLNLTGNLDGHLMRCGGSVFRRTVEISWLLFAEWQISHSEGRFGIFIHT